MGLRNAISSYLHQARGIHCHPDQIIIGAGSDYLLMLLTTVIGNCHKLHWKIQPMDRPIVCLKD